MLTKLDYYRLVVEGFKSLRRDIDEAEQFTVNEHNALLQQMQQQEEQNKQAEVQVNETEKKESKKKVLLEEGK